MVMSIKRALVRVALTWDAAKPAGSQKIRLSDEEIRDNWVALADALNREHIFPGTEGVDAGIHKVPVGNSNPSGYEGRLAIANNLLNWYSNGAWRTLIPAGTKMAFFQASVPTGWTQDTSVNDKVLRVVSGTGGGSGGSWTISGISVSSSASTESQSVWVSSTATFAPGSTTAVTGIGTGWHSHNISSTAASNGTWRPAYIDVVIGAKD